MKPEEQAKAATASDPLHEALGMALEALERLEKALGLIEGRAEEILRRARMREMALQARLMEARAENRRLLQALREREGGEA